MENRSPVRFLLLLEVVVTVSESKAGTSRRLDHLPVVKSPRLALERESARSTIVHRAGGWKRHGKLFILYALFLNCIFINGSRF